METMELLIALNVAIRRLRESSEDEDQQAALKLDDFRAAMVKCQKNRKPEPAAATSLS